MSDTREYPDQFEVVVEETGNRKPAEDRSEAEGMKNTAEVFGYEDVEILPPGNTDDKPTDVIDSGQEPEVIEEHPSIEVEGAAEDLPERDVATDPLTWMPGEFIDEIDGSQAINRKGFEVLSHFYDVEIQSDLEVPPEETEHEFCRVKATATIDGREVEAHGSAHVDRGDDKVLLLEMADTRARKRAISIATGAGAVAVEELKNSIDK